MTPGVSGVWATVWATTTGAAAIEISSGNGSAGVDHLQTEQLVKAQNGISRLSGGMLWPFASDLSGFFPATAAAGGGSSCSCSFFEKGVET